MSVGRRSFLRLAAISPFATKAAAERVAANMSGVGLTGHGLYSGGNAAQPSPIGGNNGPSKDQWRSILANASQKREIESVFFEDERKVGFIDPDLAVARSYSLNAKIAFQRQRNVERRLEKLHKQWPWERLENIGKKFLGFYK